MNFLPKWITRAEPSPEEVEARQKELDEYHKEREQEYKLKDICAFEWYDTSTEEELNKQIAMDPNLPRHTDRIIEWCVEALGVSLEYRHQSFMIDYQLDGPPYRFIVRIGVYHSDFYPGDVKYTVCLFDGFNNNRSITSSVVASLPEDFLFADITTYQVRMLVDHTDVLNVMVDTMMDDMLREHGMDFRELLA